MSDEVWLSPAMMDSRLTAALKSEMYPYPEGTEEFGKISRKNKLGFPVPADRFPSKVYWGEGRKKKKLAHFLNCVFFMFPAKWRMFCGSLIWAKAGFIRSRFIKKTVKRLMIEGITPLILATKNARSWHMNRLMIPLAFFCFVIGRSDVAAITERHLWSN